MTIKPMPIKTLEPTVPRSRTTAILVLTLLLPLPTLGALSALQFFPGPVGSALWGASKVAMVVVPIVWWITVDRGRPSRSPYADAESRRSGWIAGLGTGVAILGAIVGGTALFGSAVVDPERFSAMTAKNGLDDPVVYAGLAVSLTFVNALAEEYVWRWFVLVQLERVIGARGAILGSALGFSVHHWFGVEANLGPVAAHIAAGGCFVGGLIWSTLYARYRSIWPGYVSHVLADVGVFAAGAWILFGDAFG